MSARRMATRRTPLRHTAAAKSANVTPPQSRLAASRSMFQDGSTSESDLDGSETADLSGSESAPSSSELRVNWSCVSLLVLVVAFVCFPFLASDAVLNDLQEALKRLRPSSDLSNSTVSLSALVDVRVEEGLSLLEERLSERIKTQILQAAPKLDVQDELRTLKDKLMGELRTELKDDLKDDLKSVITKEALVEIPKMVEDSVKTETAELRMRVEEHRDVAYEVVENARRWIQEEGNGGDALKVAQDAMKLVDTVGKQLKEMNAKVDSVSRTEATSSSALGTIRSKLEVISKNLGDLQQRLQNLELRSGIVDVTAVPKQCSARSYNVGADYALSALGSTLLPLPHTSVSITPHHGPGRALTGRLSVPGECFAVAVPRSAVESDGDDAKATAIMSLGISLPRAIDVDAVEVRRLASQSSPVPLDSQPRLFRLVQLHPNDPETVIGTWSALDTTERCDLINTPTVSRWYLPASQKSPLSRLRLDVLANGGANFTCLYGFSVYAKPKE